MSVIRNGVFYLTNRFHVAVCNFSDRSQITLKCNKNKNVVHKVQLSLSLSRSYHIFSDVFCDLSLYRPLKT